MDFITIEGMEILDYLVFNRVFCRSLPLDLDCNQQDKSKSTWDFLFVYIDFSNRQK